MICGMCCKAGHFLKVKTVGGIDLQLVATYHNNCEDINCTCQHWIPGHPVFSHGMEPLIKTSPVGAERSEARW